LPSRTSDYLARTLVCDAVRGQTSHLCIPQDGEQTRCDLEDALLDRLHILAEILGGYVDDATRIDHIVRRIDDSPLMQCIAVLLALKLVVGRAADQGRLEPRDRATIESSAQGAGR